jgi:hypothetical protein
LPEIGWGKFENWRFDIENSQFFSPQNQLFQKFYLGYDRWGDRRGEYEEKILV